MMNFKSGFVGIVGRANVGKSTLINMLVDDKIAIMSDKPQTTRNKIRGIYSDDECQIILTDTPGMQTPRNKLGKFMENSSISAIKDSDVILYVVDNSDYVGRKDRDIIERLKDLSKPIILVINKVDLLNHEKLFKVITMYDEYGIFDDIVPVSALKSKNKENLIKVLKSHLKEGEKFYSEEVTTDQPTKVRIAEIVREKILHYTEEEIPHGVMVEIESLKEKKNNHIDISAVIYVERETHKKIIIGKGGRKIKGIGMASRKELEDIFEAKINIQLWVKVKENWRDNDSFIKNFGFSEKEMI